jgi:hypothetical protein
VTMVNSSNRAAMQFPKMPRIGRFCPSEALKGTHGRKVVGREKLTVRCLKCKIGLGQPQ